MTLLSAKLTVDYDQKKVEKRFDEGVQKALEAAMFRWETTAKLLTTVEEHVLTGRYRASINLNSSDGFTHPSSAATETGDGIHEVINSRHIEGGSNVVYAAKLEKQYGIFLRAIDNASPKMLESFAETLANYI